MLNYEHLIRYAISDRTFKVKARKRPHILWLQLKTQRKKVCPVFQAARWVQHFFKMISK